jgi:hypothetical protein
MSGACPSNHHELLFEGCFVRASRDSVCGVDGVQGGTCKLVYWSLCNGTRVSWPLNSKKKLRNETTMIVE